MSQSVLEKEPAPSAAPPVGGRPLVWLVGVLVIASVVRLLHVTAPLQQDDFAAVYAVLERPPLAGPEAITPTHQPDVVTPAAADPLLPVPSLADVRERSVLPYGIPQPLPLYHYLLYGVVKAAPAAEWSLRLLSLLAGIGCVAGVYALTRRFLGGEAAVTAALFAALDPIQIAISNQVRPFALANLVCVLSFLALLGLAQAPTAGRRWAAAVGYGLCLALLGYFNAVLLLVLVAHLGVLAYLARQECGAAWTAWLVGVVLAGAAMGPLVGYFGEVARFSFAQREFLFYSGEQRLTGFLLHNSAFLIGLLMVSLANYVVRRIHSSEGEDTEGVEGAAKVEKAAPPPELPPLPENPEFVWLARAWLFWPQMLALIAAFLLLQPVFTTSLLSYTTLGGVLLLAYWATREPAREMRLAVSAAVALTVFLWGFSPLSQGSGLRSAPVGDQKSMAGVDRVEESGSWRPNDVLLLRPALVEADLLPDRIPEATRRQVVGALVAPYTTLYVGKKRRDLILLSRSHHRGKEFRAAAGQRYDPSQKYTPELAARLRQYNQLWLVSAEEHDRREFLACLAPWLANALDRDVLLARKREGPERYFPVRTASAADDWLEGLSDARPTDFTHLVRIQKLGPPWGFALGAALLPPSTNGAGALATTAWRAGQERTPRWTTPPGEEAVDSGLGVVRK